MIPLNHKGDDIDDEARVAFDFESSASYASFLLYKLPN